MPSSVPVVSGIVAAYNYERFLPDALDSVLSQDYPADRLEVIVVDDGSTDATGEIARRYAAESGGVIRYVRQDNAGLCAATNRGFQEARGEYITLLDADDAWLTSRTRLLVDALERNPRAGMVYGDMEVIDADGCTIHRSWLEEAQQPPFRGRVLPALLRTNFVIAPSLMVRASLCERFSPIPTVFPAQDWYMAARTAEVSEIDFVPAAVARYRRHGTNMSHGKVGPAEVARLFRRDIVMRRWMLAHLRAPDLTVEALAEAYAYFMHTLNFAANHDQVPVEVLLDVSDADRARAAGELSAGRAALAGADFAKAAGHFVAALSANPFDLEARHGLDNAQRRLIVPLPRRLAAAPGPQFDYRIKPGYRHREAPEYFVDLVEERRFTVAQPDVYSHAAAVAARLRARRIVDLGSGNGRKLVALHPRLKLLGIDYGPNVELARRGFPAGTWREHDLDSPGPLPLSAQELQDSVLVCANLLEHLLHPEHLLSNLSELLPSVRALVISTPDRDLTSGPAHLGPPADPSRVREWNIHEFSALLEAHGFDHGSLGLTRSDSASGVQHTVLAVLYPDAEHARLMETALSAAA